MSTICAVSTPPGVGGIAVIRISGEGALAAAVLRLVAADPAVRDPHNLRTRRIGAGIAVEVHVRVDPEMTVLASHAIAHGVEDRLRARFGEWTHVIVHVEPAR